ncbi:hypothetical protein [Sphingomonas sp. RIT328]|uniref:hypothetical protein n=1 Tax=Sphingomonas sp. RIT328 TaxID=1470591 RepID=UPI0004502583|nr:hypothetical protein [Sphingomonas sp. RIT328]EZP57422.1 hypothetical protein BW41_00267 [Sphingomonas sp. RIT328]
MPNGCEFYTYDTDLLQFSSVRPPYIYLGKRDIGANIGARAVTTARQQDGQAPDYSTAIEICTVQAFAGAVQVAVTGSKLPTEIAVYRDPSDGVWRCQFVGLAGSAGSLYFFGLHPGTSRGSSGAALEFWDDAGAAVIFDTGCRPMMLRQGLTEGDFSVAVPAGRTWGALMQVGGLARSGTFQGSSSQGGRVYVRYETWGAFSEGGTVSVRRYTRDIQLAAADDTDAPQTYRAPRGMIVDLTGLG